MGGSQSTRKLTISNDDPSNVIRVSDSVVQRFRGEKTDGKFLTLNINFKYLSIK